ncbi:MAG: riboflavin synthase [Eubacterium sp.]|nr:riboflavin synthase [Eubacterium sp.]
MFTGLIEETGEIQSVQRGSRSCVLTIGCKTVLEGSKIGDSIAVNGVCLTVTTLGGSYFTADAMPETLNRSSLGQLSTGSVVNLERAMPANGRFGGHIVSGHIDGTGTIAEIKRDDNAVWYTVSADPGLLRYIVEKGSITIDGISLTVAYVDNAVFKVSIIPHTQAVTSLRERRVGDIVNLECDIIGKYVEKLMQPAGSSSVSSGAEQTGTDEGITLDFLLKNGF